MGERRVSDTPEINQIFQNTSLKQNVPKEETKEEPRSKKVQGKQVKLDAKAAQAGRKKAKSRLIEM